MVVSEVVDVGGVTISERMGCYWGGYVCLVWVYHKEGYSVRMEGW